MGNRQAEQLAGVAARAARIGGIRRGQRFVGGDGNKGIERAFVRRDTVETGPGHVAGRELAPRQAVGDLRQRQRM